MMKPAFASSVVDKRIVLVDPSGLHTIIGRGEVDLPTVLSLPVFDEPKEGEPEGEPALLEMLHFNLIRVKTRFALYRQIVPPSTSRFNDTFDPAQV